jgi:hypothetical protein
VPTGHYRLLKVFSYLDAFSSREPDRLRRETLSKTTAMSAQSSSRLASGSGRDRSVCMQGRAGGANQPVRLLENVMIVRLLSGKEADGYKQGAEQQTHQHHFPVGALVSVMK